MTKITEVRVKARLGLRIKGIVQGVGFRPFVYYLAQRYRLSGWVTNNSGCVAIEIEGEKPLLEQFIISVRREAPPAAVIQDISVIKLPLKFEDSFIIKKSNLEGGEYQPISPDIATCAECLEEVLSPGDRRYNYPFTNCSNCGPRFTIISGMPYDRAMTTMGIFTMCPECRSEYENPSDRRFHAQPIACPHCGPCLTLADGRGASLPDPDVLKLSAEFIRQGYILAIKGLGGFQLVCDATSAEAVARLRERKKRRSKPFAVMMHSLDETRQHCLVNQLEADLLDSPAAPIVLLKWLVGASSVTREVARDNIYLGVMLPYTPLHHILLRQVGRPLVMTSGNLSEEPICSYNGEALARLQSIADYFLLHNRDITSPYDDSVYFVEREIVQPIRRARGYAPSPFKLPFVGRQVLACGAEEKNSFCLLRDDNAFLSQHIGDMSNAETLDSFENTIRLYQRLFRIQPEIIAYDLHPEYLSTKYALRRATEEKLTAIPVQHHHAHIVSCMTENAFTDPVIGVAFDGTGYGPDGNLWGGEFMLCDYNKYERLAHLEYVPMPGGGQAIRRPYRMALGYLYHLLGEASAAGLSLLEGIPATELGVIRSQVAHGFNSPLTSSMGRLFDAVAALTGFKDEIDYSAQAAIEFEMLAPDDMAGFAPYPFSFTRQPGQSVTIKLADLIAGVVADVRDGAPTSSISACFHQTIAQMILETCRMMTQETGLNTVALSGGVFQNRLLFRLALDALEQHGFRVLTHHLVPCNDGGLALGQAVIAGSTCQNEVK
jgi:hydrogenase maturation protein HypF